MLRALLWLLLLTPMAFFAYCATHIPTGADSDAANEIGKYVSAGYGKFDDGNQAQPEGKGKRMFFSPGSDLNPALILYEVTSEEDIALILHLAQEALDKSSKTKSVTLHFHEKQNLTVSPNGGASRGWESAFKKVKLTSRRVAKGAA
jgi:hypothetical protein